MRATWKIRAAGGVLAVGLGATPLAAHATPYAYATNDITGLMLTTSAGALATVGTPTTTVSDGASYGSGAGQSFVSSSVVGQPANVTQAYAGPGTAPAENTFTAVGPGNFTGTRGDAAISGGTAASGGVTVQNVAEAYGNTVGRSNGANTASINFMVNVASGETLTVSFADATDLVASTAAGVGENATAAITNSFQVTPATGGSPLFTFEPGALNTTVASLAGTPPTNSTSSSASYIFTTGSLAAGMYDVSLTSIANVTITPGTSTPVPEPTSLALLGAGLLGLGVTVSRLRAGGQRRAV